MEIVIIIAIIWAVVAFLKYLGNRTTRTTTSTHRPPNVSSVGKKSDPNVYRPSALTNVQRRPHIDFRENNGGAGSPTDLDIKDLVDALTGAPLHLNAALYQCQRCKVFYQALSFEVIRAENGGRCVSCLHTELVCVTGRQEQRGRNADVNVITLANYRKYVGHVITFEGRVHTVLTSRRGTDYAVMFENLRWTQGFKMVVFRGAVDRIGGEQFLYSLANRHVRVRGLLINHEYFGYEIIISDRAMILSIK